MKQYRSNRVREAAKIEQVIVTAEGHGYLMLEDESVGYPVTEEYLATKKPQEGGYFLRYTDDGYESFITAEAFERGGYIEVGSEEAPLVPNADALLTEVVMASRGILNDKTLNPHERLQAAQFIADYRYALSRELDAGEDCKQPSEQEDCEQSNAVWVNPVLNDFYSSPEVLSMEIAGGDLPDSAYAAALPPVTAYQPDDAATKVDGYSTSEDPTLLGPQESKPIFPDVGVGHSNTNNARVTQGQIEQRIVSIRYTRMTPVMTHCIIELNNGFTVTGESACVSPDNYDEAKGQEIAYSNAFDKLWMLEGYLLKEKLWQDTDKVDTYLPTVDGGMVRCAIPKSAKAANLPATPKARVQMELADLREKYSALQLFIADDAKYLAVSKMHQNFLIEQRTTMREYCRILEMRLDNWEDF